MAQRFQALTDKHIHFISEQKIFFVGSATADSTINVSPKGMDSLRVLDDARVIWLNLTGSGNETAAHIENDPRMTLMFCSFDAEPLILRLFGRARVIHQGDPEWNELISLFAPLPGARQLFDMTINLVQTSCGFGVPCYSFTSERPLLIEWANKKGEQGLRRYWEEKNQVSLDGIPTHIVEKNIR